MKTSLEYENNVLVNIELLFFSIPEMNLFDNIAARG